MTEQNKHAEAEARANHRAQTVKSGIELKRYRLSVDKAEILA